MKYFAFLLGGVALLDGLIATVAPRWELQQWERSLQARRNVASQTGRLSNQALRYLAIGEMTLAGTILWLASRSRG